MYNRSNGTFSQYFQFYSILVHISFFIITQNIYFSQGASINSCTSPLGMENGDIVDAQLASSTPYDNGAADNCIKEHARLNYNDASTTCKSFAPRAANNRGMKLTI